MESRDTMIYTAGRLYGYLVEACNASKKQVVIDKYPQLDYASRYPLRALAQALLLINATHVEINNKFVAELMDKLDDREFRGQLSLQEQTRWLQGLYASKR